MWITHLGANVSEVKCDVGHYAPKCTLIRKRVHLPLFDGIIKADTSSGRCWGKMSGIGANATIHSVSPAQRYWLATEDLDAIGLTKVCDFRLEWIGTSK
jgi:hypothetical protein